MFKTVNFNAKKLNDIILEKYVTKTNFLKKLQEETEFKLNYIMLIRYFKAKKMPSANFSLICIFLKIKPEDIKE